MVILSRQEFYLQQNVRYLMGSYIMQITKHRIQKALHKNFRKLQKGKFFDIHAVFHLNS